VNSQWVHFERIGPFLKKLPKMVGIPGACDDRATLKSSEPVGPGCEENEEPDVGGGGGCWANMAEQEGDQEAQKELDDESNLDPELPHLQQTQTPVSCQGSAHAAEKQAPKNVAELPKKKRCKTEVGNSSSLVDLSPVSKFNKREAINGQGNNLRNRKSDGEGRLARSIDNFTKVWADVAAKGLLVEQAIAKNKLETNVQLAQMQMTLKTEIEKLRQGR
jgi:hypothetical protein